MYMYNAFHTGSTLFSKRHTVSIQQNPRNVFFVFTNIDFQQKRVLVHRPGSSLILKYTNVFLIKCITSIIACVCSSSEVSLHKKNPFNLWFLRKRFYISYVFIFLFNVQLYLTSEVISWRIWNIINRSNDIMSKRIISYRVLYIFLHTH